MSSDSSSSDIALLEELAHDLLAEMQQPDIIDRARLSVERTRALGLYSDWDDCPEKVLDFGSLIEAAGRVLPPGGSIETGVYRGGTSGPLILCAAANTFHVSIDPFGLPSQSYVDLRGEYGSWPEARRTLSRLAALGEERAVTYAHYLMSATDFVRVDLLQHPSCFRIVHLDGAHSKEAVVEELTYFRKKVKGPTLFILDDHDTNFPGVGEAINSSAGAGLVPVLHRYYAFPNIEPPCGFSAWLHAF
jgi:hypothetical protein